MYRKYGSLLLPDLLDDQFSEITQVILEMTSNRCLYVTSYDVFFCVKTEPGKMNGNFENAARCRLDLDSVTIPFSYKETIIFKSFAVCCRQQ